MTIAIDILFIEKIGHQFKRFSKTSSGTYRLRCPYCGDSTHSQYSTAAIFTKSTDGDSMYFYCHRGCGSKSLGQFLQDNSQSDYGEYVKQSLSDPFDKRHKTMHVKQNNEVMSIDSFKHLMTPLSKLNESDDLFYAKEEAISRKLPIKLFGEVFATNHLYDVMRVIPKYKNEESKVGLHEPAIVFPFYTDLEKHNISGLIFRKLNKKSTPKYIVVNVDDNIQYYWSKFINRSLPVIATEGVFDKWSVNNSVMMSGVTKWRNLPKELGLNPNQIILAFDNDFATNPNVTEQMINAAKEGFKIFIAPDLSQTTNKDLNDYSKHNCIDTEALTKLVIDNSYAGLTAIFKITRNGAFL